MKIYKIPCTWEMYGICYIEANSLEEAKQIALSGDTPLPEDKYYIDDSFQLDDEGIIEEANNE